MNRGWIISSLMMLFLCLVSSAADAAVLTILSSGGGGYVLQGSGLEGVAAMDIVIGYDASSLANPRISKGMLIADAVLVSNNAAPGQLRIAVVNRFPKVTKGSGVIAAISFSQSGDASGEVTSFTAQLKDLKGTTIAAQTSIVPAAATAGSPEPSTSPVGTSTAGTRTPGSQGSGTPVWLGGVTMPDGGKEELQAKEEKAPTGPANGTPAAVQPSEKSEPVPKEAEAVKEEAAEKKHESKFTNPPSVLDRFRDFKGERTPKALVALFSAGGSEDFRQVPEVVLTDGKTRAQLFIKIPADENSAPNFALRGAKLVALKPAGNSEMMIEFLPDSGASKASVMMAHSGSVTSIPLVVVPPLNAAPAIGTKGELKEEDFALFLRERGTEKAPKFDLNVDGVRDYVDDYIFTGNYIVRHAAESPAPEKRKP